MRLTDEQRALVEQHIGLVHVHLARHVRLSAQPTRDCETDDLFQEGFLALARAAIVYTGDGKDGPFASFAIPRIRFAIIEALRERFSTLHVPAVVQRREARASSAGSPDADAPVSATPTVKALGGNASALVAPPTSAAGADTPTIGQCLGELYADALRTAAAEWKHRRRRGGSPKMVDRIVEERMLVPEVDDRAPLRQIARELESPISNALRCERFLIRNVSARLDGDARFHVLRDAARRASDGVAAQLDGPTRLGLRDAHRRSLLERFGRLDDARKGDCLIDLARLAGKDPGQLADVCLHELSDEQMRGVTIPARPSSTRSRSAKSSDPARRTKDPNAPRRSVDDDESATQRHNLAPARAEASLERARPVP